jgi:hypothetical protein
MHRHALQWEAAGMLQAEGLHADLHLRPDHGAIAFALDEIQHVEQISTTLTLERLAAGRTVTLRVLRAKTAGDQRHLRVSTKSPEGNKHADAPSVPSTSFEI